MRLSPPHPLYGAQIRAKRAGYLIGVLRKQLQRWTDAQAGTEMHFQQVGPEEFEASRQDPPVEYLFRAAVTIGEIAYNCRAALDYLIAELARGNNRGRTVRGTQFPIEDDEAMYDARVTGVHPTVPDRRIGRYLHKVPPRAVEMLRQTQPFAGCEWTKLLRDVSNPDKHRYVPLISSHENFKDTVFDPTTGVIRGQLAVRIVFEHDRDLEVVSGMLRIQRQTAHMIRSFAPAFQPKSG